jgi:MoaA/NifB/PqqE/SkfB family radical SAM enzyme
VPWDQDVVDDLWFLDLKLGNICNLKCRICGSWSSSKWAAEEIDYLKAEGATREEQKKHTAYQMLKEGAWPRNSERFWDSLEDLLPGIRYFEFTGGEPFMIKEHAELLQRAVDAGQAGNIELHYNTNGTQYSDELAVLWRSFKSVEIAFSIDNVGERFEYERYLADWNLVNNNIRKFEELVSNNSNIKLQLCFTVNVLNVLYLESLLAWAETVNFDNYHWNMLHGPEELSIATLPSQAKTKITAALESTFAKSKYIKDIENVVAMMRNGESNESDDLVKRLQRTDQYRNQHLKQTHPELAEMLGYE